MLWHSPQRSGGIGFITFAQGLAISNSETIRSVHNGFSRQEPFITDGKDHGGENQDAFHFVAFVPFNGKVRPYFSAKRPALCGRT